MPWISMAVIPKVAERKNWAKSLREKLEGQERRRLKVSCSCGPELVPFWCSAGLGMILKLPFLGSADLVVFLNLPCLGLLTSILLTRAGDGGASDQAVPADDKLGG